MTKNFGKEFRHSLVWYVIDLCDSVSCDTHRHFKEAACNDNTILNGSKYTIPGNVTLQILGNDIDQKLNNVTI